MVILGSNKRLAYLVSKTHCCTVVGFKIFLSSFRSALSCHSNGERGITQNFSTACTGSVYGCEKMHCLSEAWQRKETKFQCDKCEGFPLLISLFQELPFKTELLNISPFFFFFYIFVHFVSIKPQNKIKIECSCVYRVGRK